MMHRTDLEGGLFQSRLEVVKEALWKQLEEIKNRTPNFRVVLVPFGSEVDIYRDGISRITDFNFKY